MIVLKKKEAAPVIFSKFETPKKGYFEGNTITYLLLMIVLFLFTVFIFRTKKSPKRSKRAKK